MSFKIMEKYVCGAQPGTIAAYVGTTDPIGWVIMDGVQRTNNSDGRYNRLAALTIGTGGTGILNYTPPDYKNAFLRGTATSNVYNGKTYTGGAVGSSQTSLLNNHTHAVSDPGHSHTTTYAYERYNRGGATSYLTGGDGGSTPSNLMSWNGTGISVNVSGSSSETRPYNYTINWILKL